MVTKYKCYLPILSVGSFDGSTWHSKCTVSPSLHSTLLRWVINTGDSYTVSGSSVCPPLGASKPSMIGRASGRKEPPSNQWRSEKGQFSVSYRITICATGKKITHWHQVMITNITWLCSTFTASKKWLIMTTSWPTK